MNKYISCVCGVAAMACFATAHAVTFETATGVRGNFDSTVTAGLAVRAKDPLCSKVGDAAYCPSADVVGYGAGDDGNLNYRKGDPFAAYIKGNHELLLNTPDNWKFLGRVSWLHDFKADDTTRTPLSKEAKREIVDNVRLLDLWLGKSFSVGGQRADVRLGNQYINWGESLFILGGINATNSVDYQRLSQPGTQAKEAYLPSPMVKVSAGLGDGIIAEGYYQFKWDRSKFAPVGGYWSTLDVYDKGRQPFYFGPDPASARALRVATGFPVPIAADVKAKDDGQYGLSLRYQPSGIPATFGAYVMNYHDKTPNLQFVNGQSEAQWVFLEKRKLYGASANFSLGNWAVGSELSYRPKDALALSSCFSPGQEGDNIAGLAPAAACQNYVDSKRYQWHLTALLSLTPGDHGDVLRLLGADTATLMAEAVVVRFPDLKSVYTRAAPDGTRVSQLPDAGLWTWSKDGGSSVNAAGSKTSWGYNFDFSWVYDGTVVPGWQVMPEIYYFQAVKGRTPTLMANFMEGAKSANFVVSFIQNPANWQASVNYAKFWGGKTPYDQPYGDRDYFGITLSRNF